MNSDVTSQRLVDAARAIPGVVEIASRLAPHATWVVGPVLLRQVDGLSLDVATLWTSAPDELIATRFDRAVPRPTTPSPAWLIPNGRVPVHLRSLAGEGIEAALARVPLSNLSLAVELASGHVSDPVGGAADQADRILRVSVPAHQAAKRDPLVVLRAGRLASEHGLSADEAAITALAAAVPALDAVPKAELAAMLQGVLLGRHVDAGVELLDRVGLRDAWFGTASLPAHPSMDQLPDDLALRLLAWLRGARPTRVLRRIRTGAVTRRRLVRLGEHHPLEVVHPSLRLRSIRRLIEVLGHTDLDALVTLRRWELAGSDEDDAARAALEELLDAVARFESAAPQRPRLAVSGLALIESLEISPGPLVGRLITKLEADVHEGRVENTRNALMAHAREVVRQLEHD